MTKIEREIRSDSNKFKKIVKESNGNGPICKIYNWCDNGRSRTIIKKHIDEFHLDYSHFGTLNPNKKYEIITKNCPVCGKRFETRKGHKREQTACSQQCANKFFAKPRSDVVKQKLSTSLKKFYIEHERPLRPPRPPKNCKRCGGEFRSKHNKVVYCSAVCRTTCPENRQKIKDAIRKRIKNGTHKGWSSRNIISYPEKFFIRVLTNNDISYQHNKPVGGYFLDFAIVDKMIDLEIDGTQHLWEERKKSDKIRDEFLIDNGWKVYRIPWKCLNKELGKKYIKAEIDNFLEFYNNAEII